MSELKVEVDPREEGFSPDRLERIDAHFRRYVEDGRLAGWLLALSRHGRVVHVASHGQRDREGALPVEVDTIWRIYSMTKPITSVAAMMLYEEGAFELKDPVSAFIPSFGALQAYRQGSALAPATEPVTSPMRIWHLLTHTSGLTYGFHHAHPVDAMYRAAGYEWAWPEGVDLAAACDTWASIPLVFQPGTEWNYGVSTDVLGRVVEVVAGQPLDAFLRERIFEPLGMSETAFSVPPSEADRLAALYGKNPADGTAFRLPGPLADAALSPPSLLSGGGGLVATAADYHRFLLMLQRGGELDGVRLLGSRTVAYMTRNHLPGGADLEAFGRPLFSETTFDGTGFGLGFSVVDDPVAGKVLSSPGEFAWGGAASTAFWVDPHEALTAMFFTQLLPSSAHPIRPQLKQLVYQALVD